MIEAKENERNRGEQMDDDRIGQDRTGWTE
jgi:hypothetical protein